MSSRIIIKNLPKQITKERLTEHIKKTNPSTEVTDCTLKFTRDGVFRKFAFLGFKSETDAEDVKSTLHKTFIGTSRIQVELARGVGNAEVRPWSKYSTVNIKIKEEQKQRTKAKEKGAKTNSSEDNEPVEEDEEKEGSKQKTEEKQFLIKMKGLTGHSSEKAIKEFFKPLKPKSIKVPRNAQRKPIGVAYVEFSTNKDMDQAMMRNKNYIGDKKIFLKRWNEEKDPETAYNPPAWVLKAEEGKKLDIESIENSGRLFVRNLYFGVTEEELEETFSKFGPLAEVTVPVDILTKQPKGFAHVIFVFPEHAWKAYQSLDHTTLHGRILHILPGRDLKQEEESKEKSSYKKKKDLEQKAKGSSSYNWNSLFLGANAVADIMAERYNVDKSNILDDSSKGSLGVRMALGETQIVSETRQFLLSYGVSLDSFSQAAGKRSKTVILVKNLPSGVRHEELKEIFNKFGTVKRVLLPPLGVTAIVEYLDPSEAKIGFSKLNFSKFRSIPLYLEWAPVGIFSKSSAKGMEAEVMEDLKEPEEEIEEGEKDETKVKEEKGSAEEEMQTEPVKEEGEDGKEDEPEAETCATIFVKNLNFKTTDEELKKHFEKMGTIVSATVAKKRTADQSGEVLSMGYGFVQFLKKKDAKEALKNLQKSKLEGHNLELKMSDRNTQPTSSGRKQQLETKQKNTKILVRNIPFEAKRKEIEELFKVFGELKFVRLPKKLQGTGAPHRGFAFVDFLTKQDAKRAFDALCHSTHLYGRRLVLEWAEEEESLDDLRRKTAQHFYEDGPRKKLKRSTILHELDGHGGDSMTH